VIGENGKLYLAAVLHLFSVHRGLGGERGQSSSRR
jgi:hypothetical protein